MRKDIHVFTRKSAKTNTAQGSGEWALKIRSCHQTTGSAPSGLADGVLEQCYVNRIAITYLLLTGQVLEIPTIIHTLLQTLQRTQARSGLSVAGYVKWATTLRPGKQPANEQLDGARLIAVALWMAQLETMWEVTKRAAIGEPELANFHIIKGGRVSPWLSYGWVKSARARQLASKLMDARSVGFELRSH